MTLNAQTWLALVAVGLVMGLLLFVPAASAQYWQAWVYLSIFMGASILTTIDLMARDPALLKRRMRGGPAAEKEPVQPRLLDVGLPKTPLAPEEDAAIHTVLKACLAKKVACGIAATGWATPEYKQKLLDEGFRFML